MNFSKKNYSLSAIGVKLKKNNRRPLSKILKPLLLVLAFLLVSQTTQAQFWKKLGKKIEKAAEETVNRKVEDKAVEKTDQAMDSLFNADKKIKRKRRNKKKKRGEQETINNTEEDSTDNEDYNDQVDDVSTENLKPWSNYNFVPGDKIIFQDDLMYEENGEFPSRWDLNSGSAENAVLGEENIINLKDNSIITPLMDKENYLPEVFTIEFDAYFFSKTDYGSDYQSYNIRFSPKAEEIYRPKDSKDSFYPIILRRDGAIFNSKINGVKKDFKGMEKELDEHPVWRHFAISFNKRSLKVFVDQYRVLSIPNLGKGFKPQQFSIEAYSYSYTNVDNGYISAIKNIRVAEGGKKLYERVIAEGRFVTRGILFDINRATLKPESMGVINRVAKMMQQHTELNFTIEGHTDSDGNDESNLELSAQRALAVKNALINMGIDQNRLQTEGKGESVPVSDNTTPEGKANNRRVEFVTITE